MAEIDNNGDINPVQFTEQGLAERMGGAQIEQMIAAANRFPRSLKKAKDTMFELATLDEPTAQSCYYSIPRGGKQIEGPSVKLAQIVASSWGNLWTQTTPLRADHRVVVVRSIAWDVETNLCVSQDVERKITDKNGRRFNEDMIAVTTNAAASIAFRNAVFRVIPGPLVSHAHEGAKQVVRGDLSTLSARREKMFAAYNALGINGARIFAAVGVESRDDIGLDELVELLGAYQGIKSGEVSMDTAFPDVDGDGAVINIKGGSKTSSLAAKVASESKKSEGKPKTGTVVDGPPKNPKPASGPLTDAEIADIKRQEAEDAANGK